MRPRAKNRQSPKCSHVGRPVAASLLIAAALMLLAPTVSADGFVVVRPHPELPSPTPLAVRYHNVDIRVRDQVAHVAIDQVFHNLNHREVEGEYLFPIPDGAAVSDFVLYVDGRPIHAEAMDAQQALRIYEELVRQTRDPALLEYAGREIFRARIYPFPARGDRRVLLDYEQLIARQGGLYRFVYPLSTEKFSSRPLESAYVTIDLETDLPIRNAYCPSHQVDIEYLDSRHVRLTWEESGTRPERDLVFYYSLAEGPMDIRMVPYRPDSGDDGYFMLLASMGLEEALATQPKDVVFVLDRSGSMDGVKIEQARQALSHCLRNLNRRDRFNIIAFASGIDALETGLVTASSHRIDQALRFVRGIEASGGTNIGEALEEARRNLVSVSPWKKAAESDRERGEHPYESGPRARFVVFLTDGLPTQGERDPERILARIEDCPGRVFPFGVGYDVNAAFLDQLALENGGTPSYVRPNEDLDSAVSGFFDRIAEPVMTDLELTVDGARIRDLEPHRLPDLFRGGQLVLFGRYRGQGRAEVTLSGLVNGRRERFTIRQDLPRRERENEFVGRLWATRRVGSLLRQIRLHGEERELVAEIKDLGLRFGIVTPYTSFLVDEDAARELPAELADAADVASWRHIDQLQAMDAAKTGGKGPASAPGNARAGAQSPAPLQAESGRLGFEVSRKLREMTTVESEGRAEEVLKVRRVAGQTFEKENEIWKQQGCPEEKHWTEIQIGSARYFELLNTHPEIGAILALGERVVFELDGEWYVTVPGA